MKVHGTGVGHALGARAGANRASPLLCSQDATTLQPHAPVPLLQGPTSPPDGTHHPPHPSRPAKTPSRLPSTRTKPPHERKNKRVGGRSPGSVPEPKKGPPHPGERGPDLSATGRTTKRAAPPGPKTRTVDAKGTSLLAVQPPRRRRRVSAPSPPPPRSPAEPSPPDGQAARPQGPGVPLARDLATHPQNTPAPTPLAPHGAGGARPLRARTGQRRPGAPPTRPPPRHRLRALPEHTVGSLTQSEASHRPPSPRRRQAGCGQSWGWTQAVAGRGPATQRAPESDRGRIVPWLPDHPQTRLRPARPDKGLALPPRRAPHPATRKATPAGTPRCGLPLKKPPGTSQFVY